MYSKCGCLYFYIFAILIVDGSLRCSIKETCDLCLQELGCAWCIKPNEENAANCMDITVSSDPGSLCSPEFLVDEISELQTISDETDYRIRPQHVSLKMRLGDEIAVPFTFKHVNFPLDLYFLMDLSASMDVYRKSLGELGVHLATEMRKLTSDFNIGFGSFVDKRDMPFINTAPKFLDAPCPDCVKAYSFRNHLKLTSDDSRFAREVTQAQKSGNIDSPEGGFDALMQVIVCNETIGWRPQARHLIVFASDADFHIAGDGKLAGVVEPNDAECHMKNDDYTMDLQYDYPSVSQINYVAKEHNMNLIFALVKQSGDSRLVDIYKSLRDCIENSEFGQFGLKTKGNIADLVARVYERISGTISITDNSTSAVQLTYKSNCSSSPESNTCSDVKIGQTVEFEVSIKPLVCSSKHQRILIKPGGINAQLQIDLGVVCDCSCQNALHPTYQTNSTECDRKGDLVCGVCACNKGRYGHNCECTGDSTDSKDIDKCIQDNVICSNMGSCFCGKCICNKRDDPNQIISGKYCECDNYSCRRNNGKLCSGTDHGECKCGQCQCSSEWSGEACECPYSNGTCIGRVDRSEGTVCSGRGTCECGLCKCAEGKYSGQFCEECADCPAQWCDQLKDCVECKTYGIGKYTDNCEIMCGHLLLNKVDNINENEFMDDEQNKICRFVSGDGGDCTSVFSYVYIGDNMFNVTAIEKRICVDKWKEIGWLLMIIISSIVGAGILILIIWKVVTHTKDAREYARFEDELAKAKMNSNQNPLFVAATNRFNNPTYRRSIWRNSEPTTPT